MYAAVYESFCHVRSAHSRFVFELLHRQHEFVHTSALADGIEIAYFLTQIIGVEHRRFGSLAQSLAAERDDIRQRFEAHAEVAVKRAHFAYRISSPVETEPFVRPYYARGRQEGRERRLASHGTCPRTAAAVRSGKGLVQVEVHDVEAHIAGTHYAHHGVEVRPVVIHQTARSVHYLRDFQHVLLEQSERVGVGEHKRCRILSDFEAEVRNVHAAVGRGTQGHRFEPRHSGGSGIGPVRAVGDEHFRPL